MQNSSSRLENCLALPVSLLAIACGSTESGDGNTADGGQSRGVGELGPDGLAEPRFVFKPADPGRAVGIRAIVTIEGQELTTEPIELHLTASDESAPVRKSAAPSRKSSSSNHALVDKAALPCPALKSSVAAMGTINGNICYATLQYTVGGLGRQKASGRSYYFGAEGIYEIKADSDSIYVPPDLANGGVGVSFGCLPGDGDGVITTAYLSELRTLSVAFNVLF